MKRAILAVLPALAALPALPACSAHENDFPSRPGGGGMSGGGGGGGTTDGGTGDGGIGDGDAGVLLSGRICVVKDLRKLTTCDGTVNASGFSVQLGTRTPPGPPTKTGEFTIFAQLGTDLVWRVSGNGFVLTVMPYGTDNTIPVISSQDYGALLNEFSTGPTAAGQGSVVVRAVNGPAAEPGVAATSTLVSNGTAALALYDQTGSTLWSQTGPTQTAGVMWFPNVDVTTTPARVTLKPVTGPSVGVDVGVVDGAITFVTQDVH